MALLSHLDDDIAFGFIGESAIRAIHKASLEILERIGCRLNHDGILKKLSDAGFPTDLTARIVKFPPEKVEKAIETAGKRFAHYGRNLDKSVEFGAANALFLCSGGQFAWVDPFTGERRSPTVDDFKAAIKVIDSLSDIDIAGAFVIPEDVPMAQRDLYLHAELICRTDKPVFTWIHTREAAEKIVRLAEIVVGGSKELQSTPIVTGFVEPISPLQFSKEALDVLEVFAENRLPVGIGPMAMCMATAPGTLAGTVAQENAEILAGITIAQQLCPGLPVCYWGIAHVMDPCTGCISFGSPEQGIMGAALTRIGKRYGFPVGINVGLTDSKLVDAQSGLEKGMTLLLGALAGADIFGHMGICGADQGASLLQLLMDNDMASYMRRMRRGFVVSEEKLGIGVVEKVGIGGNFLTEDHTLTHYRTEIWSNTDFDRRSWDLWKGDGAKSISDRLRSRLESIIANHKPKPVDDDLLSEVRAFVGNPNIGK